MPVKPFPRDTADAMALLADPARHRGNPALIYHNWLFLKEARDQHRQLHRLGPPCYLTGATVAPDQSDSSTRPAVNTLEKAVSAARPAIRAAVARYLGGDEPKGAA
jgi:hypothetical protein